MTDDQLLLANACLVLADQVIEGGWIDSTSRTPACAASAVATLAALILPQAVPAIDSPAALRTVTKTPAEAVGLSDRGEIAVGKRADLVRIRRTERVPLVRSVWRMGRRVA